MKNNFRLDSRLKTMFCTCILLLAFGFLSAQTKTISGTISSGGDLIPGVNVIIVGQNAGTITDFDGQFSIEAKKGDVLSIGHVGYKRKSVTIGDELIVNIELIEDIYQLTDVVVVGYGTLEKKELTGSQVSLKSEDINKVQAVSFEEALQGKAAGVQIISTSGGPGDAVKIQIRGATSINASSAPLYVIDGVEIDGDAQAIDNGLGGAQSSPLSLIDPATIESIDILKDANATAIYGSRGANGVVIITTKRGKGDQGVVLDLDISTGIQTISNNIDLLGAQEYVDYYNEFHPWDPTLDITIFEQKAFRDNSGNPIPLNNTKPDGTPRFSIRDWRDEVFREAIIKKYSLGVRTGSEKSWFSGNISYTDQEGIVKNSDYSRIQLSTNVGAHLTPKLEVGVNLNGGRSGRGGIVAASVDGNGTGSQSGVITNLANAAPVQGRFDRTRQGTSADNLEIDESGFVTSLGNGRILVNPVTQVEQTVSDGVELFGFGSAYLQYELFEGLKFKSFVSFNVYENQGRTYYPGSFGWGQLTNGRAFINSYNSTRWQNNNTLTYNKQLGDHKINSVLGTSILRNEVRISNISGTNFQSDSVNLDDLSAALNTESDTGREENGLLGIFGRFNYSYKGRYVLNITARSDKSSKFFPGPTQWGFFPSIGVTWNASEESFLEDVDFLSNLRLKASAGQTGNDKIGVFLSQATFGSSTFTLDRGRPSELNAGAVFNGIKQNGFALQRVSNPDLTWETTTQYDLGIELGLLKNRINIGVDVFQKDTEDLLLNKRVSGQSGFSFILENIGAVQNRGLEVSLNTVNIDKDNFSWRTNFNISFIKNEVVSLGRDDTQFEVTAPVGGNINDDFIVKVGEPLGSVYGFVSDGVYQYSDFVEFDGLTAAESEALYVNGAGTITIRNRGDDNNSKFTPKEGVAIPENLALRPGMQKLKDLNGDGIIDVENDRTVIGNPNPEHFGGITNNFRYKSWDLSVLMTWKYGNDIYNKNLLRGTDGNNSFGNKYGIVRERWTPNNTNTRQHSLRGRVFDNGIANASDYVEDGSFLRLQNISLSYKLPRNLVEGLGLKEFKVYGAIDNLYVWTKYSGYDPDVSVSFGQNAGLTPGIDFDAYPKARTFRLGVKATF